MAKLTDHPSSETTKMLLIGDTGCLTGDMIVSVKRGDKLRKLSIRELFQRFKGNHHNKQNLPTFLLADLGGYAGSLLMLDIVQTGQKEVFELIAGGKFIQASSDHQFSTEFGWKRLSELKVGDRVHQWRASRDKGERRREANPTLPPESRRKIVYSIPFHPYGFQNVVAGRDYKRAPLARIVVEAAMNGLSQEEFISILRNDPEKAATLAYVKGDVAFHHLDGDWLNNSIDNIQVLNNHEHTMLHHEEKVRQAKGITTAEIVSIKAKGIQPTFDVMMAGPEHNFIANGFVVHNSGKTGALSSLAGAGYNIRILDLDNGIDALANILRDPKSQYGKEALSRVDYETITDGMRNINGKLVPTRATAWQRAVKLLDNWKTETADYGPISTWTPQDVLVIDSLTFLSTAALQFVLSMNARLGQQPHQSDWYAGQQMIESLLQMLYDEGVKCNIIVMSHVQYIGEDNGPQRGYPSSLGKSLAPKIGRYFNTILMAKTSGSGTVQKRKILTNTAGLVELKNSAPTKVKPEYPLETGLADYFRDIRA